MSNVKYSCPEGGDNCGTLFAAPGGTTIKCRWHPEAVYQQVEEFGGADSLYVDDAGHTKSQGHVVTPGVESTPQQAFTEPAPPTDTVPQEQIILDLRAEYKHITGEEADKRWAEKTLREEIEYEIRVAKEREAANNAEATVNAEAAEDVPATPEVTTADTSEETPDV